MTTSTRRIAAAIDDHLDHLDVGPSGLPGVIAGVTTAHETQCVAARGEVTIGTGEQIARDAICSMYSVTKSLSATVAVQLVEQGLLDLDAPAADYEPRLGDVAVLDGFDATGTPRLRAPRTPITTRQLLTHTSGFGYTFFDADTSRAAQALSVPDVATGSLESLRTPLAFDPGSRWLYGIGLDWVGLVIESITGKRVGAAMRERLLDPLGMRDSTFVRDEAMLNRAATIHARVPDGSLKPLRRPTVPDTPAVDLGGQGLYSTVDDLLAFLRMWLADGRSDDGEQVLHPETVRSATANQLRPGAVTPLPGIDSRRTHSMEFFPGIPKGWALIGMTNEQDAPTGRSAGSFGSAGLANIYFWADRRADIAGVWATQVFPFGDPTAFAASTRFEKAVYESLR
ncbi:serine hydrolase domain-containing protein [Gordonia aichiensis]